MDRTQKKCLIVSTGAHLLLAFVLVIDPAFGSSKPRSQDMRILDFVPVKTVDALLSGGGYRDGSPPSSALIPQPPPPAPQPKPQPVEKQREPDPPKENPKEAAQPKAEPESLVPSTQKKKMDISTTLVTRKK